MRLVCNKPVLPKNLCRNKHFKSSKWICEFWLQVFAIRSLFTTQGRTDHCCEHLVTQTAPIQNIHAGAHFYLLPQSLLQLLFSPFVKYYSFSIIKCSAVSERYSLKNNRKHCLLRIQFEYQVFQTYLRYTSSIISYHSNQRTWNI